MYVAKPVFSFTSGLRVGSCPLLFAEVSLFVQAARQDAERVPLGQGWPIGACRRTNG